MDYREITLPVLTVLLLFLTSVYLPVVGLFAGIFTPLPLAFVYLKKGRAHAVWVLGVSSVVLLLSHGEIYAALFFFEYGVMALVMGEAAGRGFLRDVVVSVGAALPLVCGFLVFNAFFGAQDLSLVDLIRDKFELILRETINAYKEMGMDKEFVRQMEDNSGAMARQFVRLLPAWFFSGFLITGLINYSVLKKIWGEGSESDPPCFREPRFSLWVLSDHFVWVLIAAGLLSMVPSDAVSAVGINLLVVSILIYMIHGAAIIANWLERNKKYRIPLFAVVILLLDRLLVFLAIAVLGMFDIWFDFRKIRDVKEG